MQLGSSVHTMIPDNAYNSAPTWCADLLLEECLSLDTEFHPARKRKKFQI